MALVVAGVVLWTVLATNAAVTVWTGQGAGEDQWSNPDYWSAGVPGAADTAQFGPLAYLVHFDGDTEIRGLELTEDASGSRWLIFGQFTLTTSSLVNDSTAGTMLDLATDLTAPVGGLSVLANSGPIMLAGGDPGYIETVTLNGDLEIGGDSDTYIYGPITGTGGLTKDGSGTLTVFVSEFMNDFAGDVTLNDGLLVLDGFDADPGEDPTGNALGEGDIYLHGGTLAMTGTLDDDYEMLNPTQTVYVGGPDGDAVTFDAAHVASEVSLGDGVSINQYAAGLSDESDDGADATIMNNLVLGYDNGGDVVAANLVLGNPTDGDDLMFEFELMDEQDPEASTITLLGAGVQHSLTAYAEVDIEHKITGDGGLLIAPGSSFVVVYYRENDFAGGLEMAGGILIVEDSNQTGTSGLGTGTFTITGDASDASKVVVGGMPTEIYYDEDDSEWKTEDDDAWDGSIGTIEIGNDVEMQGHFATGGFTEVEMDDWFDDDNEIPVALIGSHIEISGPVTLVGDTELAVVTVDAEVEDDVPADAVDALNLPDNYFTLEISGDIDESGGARTLTKVGEGTLILSGTNTFTGGLNVYEGLVSLEAEDTITTAPLTIAEDAAVEFGADQTLKALNGSGHLDAQVNNLTLGTGTSAFNGTFENLLDVIIAGGTHAIDSDLSLQSLAVDAGTFMLNGDISSDEAITIAGGATAAFNGAVEFYFDDAIENSGTLIGGTDSLGAVDIELKDGSALKAAASGLVASSVSVDADATVILNSTDGLLTLDDPTFNGDATINQTGEHNASISDLDNQAGNTIALNGGTLYLIGDEIWASGGAGGGVTANAGTTLIVDAPTQNIEDITGDGTIIKTTNAYASQDDYYDDLGTVDGDDLTLGDATIATSQGGTLEIEKDVQIEEGSTVQVVGESTVVVPATNTLTVADNATLQVEEEAQMQVDGALDIGAGQTLNVAGGGTVAINSSNADLDETATVAVSDSTLTLGSAAATGNAQVALADSVVNAAADEVAVRQANVSGNVQVTGNTLAVETLRTDGDTALQVAPAAQVQVNQALDIDAGETLNVTGGGTMAINSSNAALDEDATVAVADSTLTLGNAAATGNAQVTLANATVQAAADDVAIRQVNVSGNVEFAGNAVAVGTLDTSGGAASLTTGNAGVEVETLSGANNVTVAQGSVTLTGDSEAFGQTLDVSDGAAVEIEEDAVLGGSVTLAGAGTINGTVMGAVTVNDADASLGGSGDFQGGLTITNGVLAPGQSPGEITVSGGDFELGAGAILNIEVDEEGNHDSIRITDDSNANFVTGAKVVAVAIGDAADGTYDIVTLEGAGHIQVDGGNQAADANLADFIENTDLATISSLVVDDTGKIVEMSVDFTSNTEFLSATGSRTVRSFGDMLDSEAFAETAGEALLDVVAAAQASDDVAGAYAQMTNQLQTSVSSAASGVTSSVNSSLSRRMQDARTATREGLNDRATGPLLASLSPTVARDPSDAGWQGYLQGYGRWGDRDDAGGVVGYDYDTYGTLLGAERFLGESGLLGGSIGYGRTDVDSADSLSAMDMDSLTTSLYGTWFNHDYYLGMTVGYGYHNVDEMRDLRFAGLRAKGDFKAHTFSIAPEVGKLLRYKSFGIEPYAGLNYTHFRHQSYTETGADAANLSVNSDTDDNLALELGTRLRKTWVFDNGSYVAPQLRFAWRHDFGDETNNIARLAGAETSFKTTGISVVNDVFSVGAGLNWRIDKSKMVYAQYDAEFGSGYDAHTLQASIKVQF
jgi:outer membrane autotransporter protein